MYRFPSFPTLTAVALMLALGGCKGLAPAADQAQAQPAQAAAAPDAETLSEQQVAALGAEAEEKMAAGDLSAAVNLYNRILRANPRNAPAWFRLGTAYLRMEQPAYAQQSFENALRADPTLTKANANLALAHLYQFRAAAARAVVSPQVPEANRNALQSLLRDVDYALKPAAR